MTPSPICRIGGIAASTEAPSDAPAPSAKARRKLKKKPVMNVGDALLDQDIFSGVGNIIKNEVLFNLGLLPEVKVGELTARQQRALVREVRISAAADRRVMNSRRKSWKV